MPLPVPRGPGLAEQAHSGVCVQKEQASRPPLSTELLARWPLKLSPGLRLPARSAGQLGQARWAERGRVACRATHSGPPAPIPALQTL